MKHPRIIPLLLTAIFLTSCAPQAARIPKTTFPAVPYTSDASPEAWTAPPPEPLPELDSSDSADLSEIRAELEAAPEIILPNVKILRARVPNADSMPIIPIKLGISPDYDLEAFAAALFGDRFDTSDGNLYTEKYLGAPDDEDNVARTYCKIFVPDESDSNMLAIMHSTGHLRGSATGYLSNPHAYSPGEYEIKEIYDLDIVRPAADLSYATSDGEEWNALEAIEFVEDFWNDYAAPSDPEPCRYRVKRLTVVDLEDGTYGYYFELEKTDEKGRYIDMNKYLIYDRAALAAGEPFIFGCGLSSWCPEKETFTNFTRDISFSEQEPESDTELITLSKAAEILSEALPEDFGRGYAAELTYEIRCKGYPYASSDGDYHYDEQKLLNCCEFELCPYWVFKKEGYSSLEPELDEEFFVDAITGEFSAYMMNMWLRASETRKGDIFRELERLNEAASKQTEDR